MAVTLAFYRGRGTVLDRLIRWATRSRYSHVEMVLTRNPGVWDMVGASPRDGGVRRHTLRPKMGHWDLVEVRHHDPKAVQEFALGKVGERYDWLAIALTHILALRRERRNRWLCTELVAHALGEPELAHLSPGDLHTILPRLMPRD
ncbi:MAG: hypothetical protein ROR55_21100 [Devosia sp.]